MCLLFFVLRNCDFVRGTFRYEKIKIKTKKNKIIDNRHVEQYANQSRIITLYLRPIELSKSTDPTQGFDFEKFETNLNSFLHEFSILSVLPRHKVSVMFNENANPEEKAQLELENNMPSLSRPLDADEILTPPECAFAQCAWMFAHQFLNRYGTECMSTFFLCVFLCF